MDIKDLERLIELLCDISGTYMLEPQDDEAVDTLIETATYLLKLEMGEENEP